MNRMKYTSDSDGKSKTASAVDQAHYPEQHEVENTGIERALGPSHAQIAARAFELWGKRGCPHGSPDDDWFKAQEELQALLDSFSPLNFRRQSGSVQR